MARLPHVPRKELGTRPVELEIGPELKRLRQKTGLSLRAFAETTQFSPSFISQVENGTVSPSVASLAKLTAALGVTLADLFAAGSVTEVSVVRASARSGFRSTWSKAQVDTLIPRSRDSKLDALLITLEPGGRSGKDPEETGVDQFAMALDGAAVLTYGAEDIRLGRGDSVMIRARAAHVWSNTGRRPVQILIVSLRR
jgi:transcriptional regulator with XRE-family HTH domain